MLGDSRGRPQVRRAGGHSNMTRITRAVVYREDTFRNGNCNHHPTSSLYRLALPRAGRSFYRKTVLTPMFATRSGLQSGSGMFA